MFLVVIKTRMSHDDNLHSIVLVHTYQKKMLISLFEIK